MYLSLNLFSDVYSKAFAIYSLNTDTHKHGYHVYKKTFELNYGP